MMLRALRLTKTYMLGKVRVDALRGVDFELERGGFLAIMGPSGSGKSTLMNLVGCLDRPTTGTLFLGDADVSRLSADQLAVVRNKQIGFVFQQFMLLANLTAVQNVELPLMYAGVLPRERRKRAEEALDRVGLADRAHHRPMELSGGQQQRVAVARALINEPAMLIADEPTGALDTRTGKEILGLMTELSLRGHTVVIVTHDPEVARYARRIMHLRDGLIERVEEVVPA